MRWSSLLTFALVLLGSACSARQTHDGGESEADASATETGSPADLPALTCADAYPDCEQVPDCMTVVGIPPSYDMDGCYFSDLTVSLGCAATSCEELTDVVACNDEDPSEFGLIFEGCIPLGWSPCPDAC